MAKPLTSSAVRSGLAHLPLPAGLFDRLACCPADADGTPGDQMLAVVPQAIFET